MKLKRFFNRSCHSIVNALALMLVVQSANSACCWLFHEPEFPTEANKFRK